MFKVSNKNIRTRHWCFYELWTYLTYFSSVSNVEFEQVNASWVFASVFGKQNPAICESYFEI